LVFVFADYLTLLALTMAVSRTRHASIEIIAFDEVGKRLSSREFLRLTLPEIIVRDTSGAATFGFQFGLRAPRIAIPPGQAVSFDVAWTVPAFGRLMLTANNNGHGYKVSAGAYTRIELLPEFARTRLQQLETWVADHNEGRYAAEAASELITNARALMAGLDATKDLRQRSEMARAALRLAARASEQEVMAEAQNSIRDHRRGSLALKLIDARGAPVKGVKVRLVETRPEFLFGVFNYGYDQDTIARLKTVGLNYATLHMNWQQMEPQSGQFAFKEFDGLFNPSALKDNGFSLRGHALVWLLSPATGVEAVPKYLKSLRGKPAELSAKVHEHVSRIVNRYKDRVDIWEANNEGHAAWASWGLSRSGIDRVVKTSAETIRHEAPGVPIMINLATPLGENVPLADYPLLRLLSRGLVGPFSIDPYKYLQELSQAHVPFDLVGLQFYYGGNVRSGYDLPAIDLFRFASELDRYAHFGKPLHVTEISVGSSGFGAPRSWWHATADQVTQADYLVGAFTIAYGNPHVQAINWWDLYDRASFIESGGLIDKSGHPKLSYDHLAMLLAGWRSSGELVTDDNGSAVFTGVPGDYQLSADSAGENVTGTAHIHLDGSDVVVMSMRTIAPRQPFRGTQPPSNGQPAAPFPGTKMEIPPPDQLSP
jgi:GH35 family endo-1,4-beta-xylanase